MIRPELVEQMKFFGEKLKAVELKIGFTSFE